MNISAQHFLLCQLWFVIFQSTRFKKGNALFSNPIQMKNSGDVLEAVHNTSLTSAPGCKESQFYSLPLREAVVSM